ncbi:hypothetical protein GCM10022275_16960 [Tessaracoccus defluvii]
MSVWLVGPSARSAWMTAFSLYWLTCERLAPDRMAPPVGLRTMLTPTETPAEAEAGSRVRITIWSRAIDTLPRDWQASLILGNDSKCSGAELGNVSKSR